MRWNPRLFGIGALAVSLAVVGCCHSESKQTASVAHESSNRKPAPDFTLKDADGNPVKLSDFRGKVVLLNFWATWCGPCGLEIPWFEEFEQQYKSRGFEVLGVSMDDDGWPAIKPFAAAKKINYRVVLGNDSVTQLYGGVDSLPTSFLIDRQGDVAYVHVGLAGKNEYSDEIQGLLGGGLPGRSTASLRLSVPAVLARPAK